mmetsp:Transcript_18953/g.39104  ORF Transcript_18953/g.39104 Transcript_18953/m.39104 type:complete len:82 (-) Transcript_18953:186-431(-)
MKNTLNELNMVRVDTDKYSRDLLDIPISIPWITPRPTNFTMSSQRSKLFLRGVFVRLLRHANTDIHPQTPLVIAVNAKGNW